MTQYLAILLKSGLSLAASVAVTASPPAQHQLQITDPPPQLVQTGGVAAWRTLVSDYDQWEAQNDPITAGDEGDEAALFRLPDASPAADDARRTALFEFQRRIVALKGARLRDIDAGKALP